jgi:glycosyltransferase involved in cell wall biosynthesis
VVHPPVDTDFFVPARGPAEPFALVVSALVPYKRVDLAVDACRLAGIPLVIVGQGPERGRLEARGAGQVTFMGAVSDEDVRDLYQRTQAVLLPGEEDFGIVPVEAQACGRPVVALARGGALETVIHGETGVLVDDPSPSAFAAALRSLPSFPFDPARLRAHAGQFSTETFLTGIERQIDDLLQAPAEEARW